MFDSMYYGVYMFFASLMICSAIFVFFLVPETKGIPLEKMDRLFAKGLPARRAHKTVLAESQMDDRDFRRASLRGADEKAELDESEGAEGYMIDQKRVQQV
jgi:Sugar (and other) transporter